MIFWDHISFSPFLTSPFLSPADCRKIRKLSSDKGKSHSQSCHGLYTWNHFFLHAPLPLHTHTHFSFYKNKVTLCVSFDIHLSCYWTFFPRRSALFIIVVWMPWTDTVSVWPPMVWKRGSGWRDAEDKGGVPRFKGLTWVYLTSLSRLA